MKIFITGASGFIGNELAMKLADHGNEIHALVRREPESTRKHKGITYFRGDITDPPSIQRAIKNCEEVYHVAGYAKLWAKRRRTFFDINVTGTENILRASLENNIRKLVFTSSCAVFGPSLRTPITETDPRITSFNNDYDLSKFIAEKAVHEYCNKGLETVIVNPSRVYGPGLTTHANMITKMILRCMKGQWVLMPGINKVIGNYAFIDDVVNGHMLAMEKGVCGERYIIGGENLSYQQLIEIIKDEIRQPKIIPLPAKAVIGWGYIELMKNKLTGREPKFTPKSVDRYLRDAAFDCSKAINGIGYGITGFRDGIRKTVNYLNATI